MRRTKVVAVVVAYPKLLLDRDGTDGVELSPMKTADTGNGA